MQDIEKIKHSQKQYELLPKQAEKTQYFYDSILKRDLSDLDQKYNEVKEEVQNQIQRVKDLNKLIDLSLRYINKLKINIEESNCDEHKFIQIYKDGQPQEWYTMKSVENQDKGIDQFAKEDIKHRRQSIKAYQQELKLIKTNFLPLLKLLKNEIRQERFEAFNERVMSELHINEVLESATEDEIKLALELARIVKENHND